MNKEQRRRLKKNAYYDLVLFASTRKRRQGIYYERHHIKPVALGGSNHPRNIVYLTAVQHYCAHKLLVSFLTGKKQFRMVCALKRFTGDTRRRRGITSQEYRRIKILHAKAVSKLLKGKRQTAVARANMKVAQQLYFKNNPGHFLGKKHSKLSASRIGRAQRGYRNHLYGKHRSDETKTKISRTMFGHKKSHETIEKFRKRKMSRSDIAKIKAGLKRYWDAKRKVG